MAYYPQNELYHYGIKGMKWGVRRTPEQLGHHNYRNGKLHYQVSDKEKKAVDAMWRKANAGTHSANSAYDRYYKLAEAWQKEHLKDYSLEDRLDAAEQSRLLRKRRDKFQNRPTFTRRQRVKRYNTLQRIDDDLYALALRSTDADRKAVSDKHNSTRMKKLSAKISDAQVRASERRSARTDQWAEKMRAKDQKEQEAYEKLKSKLVGSKS